MNGNDNENSFITPPTQEIFSSKNSVQNLHQAIYPNHPESYSRRSQITNKIKMDQMLKNVLNNSKSAKILGVSNNIESLRK